MYTSRGIGRQNFGDRRDNQRDGRTPDAYPYGPASPDPSSQLDDRDYERKPKIYDERQKDFKNSPNYENSYGSSSKGGYTPPGPPPNSGPTKEPPYVPNPKTSQLSKPLQSNYSPTDTPKQNSPYVMTPNQSFNTSRPPNPPTSKYTPTPTPSTYRPSSNPSSYSGSSSNAPYGRDPFAAEQELREQKEAEEALWQQKCAILFQGVNTIEQLIDIKEQYTSKAQSLDAILQKSALREGEILRNKRRDRDGFKDPMMLELKKMQEDIKRKWEEVNKFRVEIDKRIRTFNKLLREENKKEEENKKKVENDKTGNYEAQLLQNSMISSTDDNDEEDEEDEYEYENSMKDYFDPGNHWCRDCDKMVSNLEDFFEHLHNKEHLKTSKNAVKPWRKPKREPIVNHSRPQPIKTKTAIKGVQFLIPIRGYYCPLCKDYLADNIAAEEHMKGPKHNRIYHRFTCLNMDYEHIWSSDKGKALARHQNNERKRIQEEEKKDLERKKKLEEQKAKEEKENRKKRKEEEFKRKMKEEKERERERSRDREEFKKNRTNSISGERFRLKSVTMNLKEEKPIFTFHKDFERSRERESEKHKKKALIYCSDSDSDSSPPPKKKQTYFGDPYKDPKLKLKPFVKLIPLNKRTAKRFQCRELYDVLQEAKERQNNPTFEPKRESKTEITLANSPITMEIDNHEEDNDKDLKGVVDGILQNLDDDDDKCDTKSGDKEDEKSDDNKPSNVEKDDNPRSSDNFDKSSKSDQSIESESNLVIDLNQQKDTKDTEFKSDTNAEKSVTKESEDNEQQTDTKEDSNSNS